MTAPFLSMAVNRLGVPRSQLADAGRFYCETLGMQEFDGWLGFEAPDFRNQISTVMELVPSDGPDQKDCTAYWKIGVGLPDVNAAVENLKTCGVSLNPGSQFLDVGFLTHLKDPVGYTIELLQDTFEKNFHPPTKVVPKPLACECPKVGQVTLRVSDIEQSLAFYRDILGMRLLCWYPVTPYGFNLYFLAFTDDQPPDANLEAEVNREWTYSRPYTTLELYCSTGERKETHSMPSPGSIGWQGLIFGVSSVHAAEAHLETYGVTISTGENMFCDPDGYQLFFKSV